MYQELLLKEIRKKIGDKSLNDEIANILNISYDASHRRTSLKAKFSFEEGLELARYYQISLDQLITSDQQLLVRKTSVVNETEDLQSFFQNNLSIFENLPLSDEMTIYYSAKDIPFFYTLSDTLLSRFKIYVWMNLLNAKQVFIPFLQFSPPHFESNTQELKKKYEAQNIVELWNDRTISSILQQILFYYETGLLQKNEAEIILKELKELIEYIEQKTENNPKFQLYENELMHLSNDIFFHHPQQSLFALPANMFGYILINDAKTCIETRNYFEHQIKNSKSLNTSGNRDRKIFFNKMYQQIEHLKQKL
ncbi:XRE family transcriptional regulator [Chryseobacterium carnipullorum]|uniref:XRE family transcriptional regulator n=1 Tax=Chryseobacterium carnipullorum TaxID=1124835 RepID=UPI000E932198|nr:XRE family transcriptional regulator [Chryseobacterium carnipullorum]MDN5397248.1 XRE family transcriptional regulator [Chryseobacterium sp.]MDN5422108.1 XRE family transcriptional regulator [Chryseobacterium sp.]MDN5479641.1 XRE family transcriptional regulator [Chryseobacterium sp.]HBV14121.1 transcriptional regulator [Chryseobacterium carnipullorum]